MKEKYGVEIDESKVKEAGYVQGEEVTGRWSSKEPNLSNPSRALCPKCKKTLSEPSKCDDCGTEPFERRNG